LSNDIKDWLDGFSTLNPIEDSSPKGKEYLVDMFRESLPALDMGDKTFYKRKTADQKKEIEKSMWILMRFMSASKSAAEHHLLMVNDLVNANFNLLVKKAREGKEGHAELQWMLLALCGSGRKQYHEKVPAPKGLKKNKLEEALLEHYPLLKTSDLELLLQINSTEDFELFFKDNGYDDKTIKEILKTNGKSK
jgi:hypothetical protein